MTIDFSHTQDNKEGMLHPQGSQTLTLYNICRLHALSFLVSSSGTLPPRLAKSIWSLILEVIFPLDSTMDVLNTPYGSLP